MLSLYDCVEISQSFNLEWNNEVECPPAVLPNWHDSQFMSPISKLSQHMRRGTYKKEIAHEVQ